MTTQRITGAILFVFTASVSVVHIIRGDVNAYLWYYIVTGAFLLLSAIFENKVFKISQISILVCTGILISYGSNEGKYTGIIMMSFGYIFAFTYGLLEKNIVAKTVLWCGAYFVIFALSSTVGTVDVLSGLVRLMMCSVITILLWLAAKDLIDKARRVDILEKMFLEEQNETMKEAGVILAKEIRSRGTGNGCEG